MKLRLLAVFAVLILAPLVQGQEATTNSVGEDARLYTFEDATAGLAYAKSGLSHSSYAGATLSGSSLQADNSTKSIRYVSSGVADDGAWLSGTGGNACGSTLDFSIYLPQYPSGTIYIGAQSGTGFNQYGEFHNGMWVSISNTGVLGVAHRDSTNSGGANLATASLGQSIATGQWHLLRLTLDNCPATTGTATTTLFVPATEGQVSVQSVQTGVTANNFGVWHTTSPGSAGTDVVFIDNVIWPEPPTAAATGDAWCPDPGDNTNLGFNYRTNVNYESGQPGLGITTTGGYHFLATQTQTAYAAKVFETTTSDAELHLRLEAGTEGQESVFEAYFLTQDPTTYLGGTEVLDATDVPDSGTGGILDDAVIVRFTEVSNDWRIAVLQNVAGSITQVGPAVTTGDPNVPTNFILKRDASIGGYLQVIIDGTQVMERYPDPEQPITGFVLRSTGSGTIIESRTVVDDQSASFASSCYFANDVNTLTPVGNQGTDVGDPVPDSPTPPASGGVVGGGSPLDPTDAGAAFGVGADAMGWFFGILFTLMISAALYTVKPGLALAGIPLGIGGAVAFGYIPLWFVFFLFMLAAAAVVLRFKTSGGES